MPLTRSCRSSGATKFALEGLIEVFNRAELPTPPYQDTIVPPIKVQAPVLQIHGLQDQRVLAGGLNNTWDWLANEWTLLTVPEAGHFVQHDASALVTQTMWNWLTCSRGD